MKKKIKELWRKCFYLTAGNWQRSIFIVKKGKIVETPRPDKKNNGVLINITE